MMPNNHNHQGCGYEEQLVSYLYGETSPAEIALFEAHLDACAPCAAELKAFAGVKFSITEWKTEEFNELPAPAIFIPSQAPQNAPEPDRAGNRLWRSKLSNLLSLSPAWSLTTAAAAILAVFLGIAFFALNSKTGSEVAQRESNSKIAVTPTAEKSPEASNSNTNQNNSAEREPTLNAPQKTPQPQIAVEKRPSNQSSTKTVNNSRPAPKKTETAVTPKNDQFKRSTKNNNDVAPNIVEDEDEDDTLRLAELFEELDTVE